MSKYAVLVLLVAVASTAAFSPIANSGASRTSSNIAFSLRSSNSDSDFPPPEEDSYTGDVDWDAEWKKVVASEKTGVSGSSERPGKDYYKSEAEIAAIKAANKATEQAASVGAKVSNALPDIRSLSGDWKFWIALLAIISVGTSLLTAPSSNGDSYYI